MIDTAAVNTVNDQFISVVIPAYNEEKRIQATLRTLHEYLQRNFRRFEIIVVNDGSSDDTYRKIAEVATARSATDSIVTLSFSPNHGKGFAVRQGVLKAHGDFIVFTDADLSTPAEEIEKAVAASAEGYPVVIASRRHPDSVIERPQGWMRQRLGRLFNLLVRGLLSLPFNDTQCGFKCFTREAAGEIFTRARLNAFVFDVEILLIARKLGYAVREIPISWSDFAGSKVGFRANIFPILRELFTIYINDRRGVYYKVDANAKAR